MGSFAFGLVGQVPCAGCVGDSLSLADWHGLVRFV